MDECENCEGCHYEDTVTGACTLDEQECLNKSAYVKAVGPEDMFKVLYMLIYNLGGELEVSAEDLAKEIEMKIEHCYDPETKKFVFTTKPGPPAPSMIMVPKKLIKKARTRQPIIRLNRN